MGAPPLLRAAAVSAPRRALAAALLVVLALLGMGSLSASAAGAGTGMHAQMAVTGHTLTGGADDHGCPSPVPCPAAEAGSACLASLPAADGGHAGEPSSQIRAGVPGAERVAAFAYCGPPDGPPSLQQLSISRT